MDVPSFSFFPGSLEGGFCPMGSLTKSSCCFEGVLIVPREKIDYKSIKISIA